MHEGLRYRADIDGLRAVAVLAVVLFHARLGVVPGGYVGVDIFFVISGFLISSIIIDGLKQSTFSMAQFYDRRVRRIFPALFTVMAACMAAGWIYLTPADYKNFAISVTSTAVFLSNVSFNRKAGYFAPAASTQPLLHTWSLGVEEQFYAIVPFVLILLYRHAWRTRAPIILGAALLSLGYAAYGVDHEWTSAFYLLPSRAWELLTGMAIAAGIVPAITWRPAREAAGLTGLAMITVACLLYTSETHFPGLAALLPCVGTALLIHSGNGKGALPPTAVSRLLSLPALVFTGKISYSLYLWHWPLLAFAEYNWPEAFNTPLRLGLIALAVVLSVLTWRFVEQPARQKSLSSARPRVFLSGGAAIAAALVTGYAIRLSDGVINRLPPEAREFVHNNPVKIHDESICQLKEAPGTSESSRNCTIGARDGVPSFVLWGDSHALAIAPQMSKTAAEVGLRGYFVATGGCPPLLGLEDFEARTFGKCAEPGALITELLRDANIKTVVFFSRWALYAEGAASPNETGVTIRHFVDADPAGNRRVFETLLDKTVRRITGTARDVVIFGPVPELPYNLQSAVIKSMMRREPATFSLPLANFQDRQRNVLPFLAQLSQMPNTRVFFPHQMLCQGTECRTMDKGGPLYSDDDHLNERGAALLAPLFRQALVRQAAALR